MGKNLPQFVAQWGTLDTPTWYEGQKGWGNHHEPDAYVADANPNYPVGTKFTDGDRTFIYGYVYSVASGANRAMGGMMNMAYQQDVTTSAVIEPVGETAISIVGTTPATTANQWAGGYAMPYAHPLSSYRILSNTAESGSAFTMVLERGLLTATSSGMTWHINQHPYSKMSCQLPNAGDESTSCIGVGLVRPTATNYMWVQTWGPCYCHGGDDLAGAADYIRDVRFAIDGSLLSPASYGNSQYAGYALPKTETGGTHKATWFIYLMIAR